MKKYFDLFGAKPNKKDLERYQSSENWQDGSFQNIVDTSIDVSISYMPKLLYKQFFDNKNLSPVRPLEIIPFDADKFLSKKDESKIIWYGHSVVLLRINNKTVLIDPMFGADASPIAPVTTKRFSKDTIDIIDTLPEIDLVLLSHDHYDHLDYASIKKLQHKVKGYYVALGIKRHLVKWGVDADTIVEFDWWDKENFNDIQITYTPTRHFSGRGLTDRAKSLWGGWALKSNSENIWFSGDGGYGEHFKEIGEKLGPFDFGFIECGQYNKLWENIHLFPEHSVQAALDAKVSKAMPVHWAGFVLSHHKWAEPAKRFDKSADAANLEKSFPLLGQIFSINENLNDNKWWKTV